MAANGYAAEVDGIFIYDRIVTHLVVRFRHLHRFGLAQRQMSETSEPLDHQRCGLGSAIMAWLGGARQSGASQQILTATQHGRMLYQRMGWRVVSPWATAAIARDRCD